MPLGKSRYMQYLTPTNVQAFLKRHAQFYDGVIRRAELAYPARGALRLNLDLHVEVQDEEADSGWSQLRLSFEDVLLFRVIEGSATNVVMSPNGAQFFFVAGLIHADFSPATDPLAEEPAERLADFAESSFAVKAHSVRVQSVPIT